MLSHAGIKKRNHSVIWFGDLSYSKLNRLEIDGLDDNKPKCPYCNNDLVELFFIGQNSARPPELEVELFVDVDNFAIVKSCEFVEPSYRYADTNVLDSIIESIA